MRRILAIDDDREMVDLLTQSLTKEGFDLSTAQTGEGGIELVRKAAPDLILLDVSLPDISGFEVLRRDSLGFAVGLAIARRAIGLHHGTITARNLSEGGLEVSVQLPVSPVAA